MENLKRKYDIAIVGAGASGMAAASAALKENPELSVIILEKNDEAGKKLYATGNGHCNFLNINADKDSFYSEDDEADTDCFVEDVLSENGVFDVLSFFKGLGITPSFEDEEGRLYPRSNQAGDIVKALLRGSKDADFAFGFELTALERLDQGFKLISASGDTIYSDRVILAAGGKAGIQYGCDGRCYKLAESLGHTVIKPIPALTGFIPAEDISSVAGVRTSASVFLLACDPDCDDIIAEDSGEIQFSKDGISGICVMNLARNYVLSEGVTYKLAVDFFNEYTDEELLSLLEERQKAFDEAYMLLESLLPSKLCEFILKGYDGDLNSLAKRLKFFTFDLKGTKGWPDAQVTSGGIKLSEIDADCMKSKIDPMLYFAGEIVDIDGLCGGYNLTWAFASGLAAGRAAASEHDQNKRH